MKERKYVSGIRPSGKLHLGNYLGAIKHWKELQNSCCHPYADCHFFVADMHGEYQGSEVRETGVCLNNLGIDIKFQSTWKPELLDLVHEFSFHVTTGQLDRMTQFKDKVANKESPTAALYTYPILMAADILLHGATHVPVGADQKQHVEFVRDLVDKIGGYIKPEPVILPVGSRIMSLTNPAKKMSKSDADVYSCIYLSDNADTIRLKLKKAVSNSAGIDNLQSIAFAIAGIDAVTCTGTGNEKFKAYVADLIIAELGK